MSGSQVLELPLRVRVCVAGMTQMKDEEAEFCPL